MLFSLLPGDLSNLIQIPKNNWDLETSRKVRKFTLLQCNMAMTTPRNPDEGGLGSKGHLDWDCSQFQMDQRL